MNHPGVLAHPAGELSLGAVLDIGLKCPHSCAFCYYSFLDGSDSQFAGLRKAGQRPTAHCLEIVRLIAAHGLRHLDITGGEPTAHSGLVDMVREAAQVGLATRCITLGQFLGRKRGGGTLLDSLLEAGLTDLLFSLHACGEEAFRTISSASMAPILGAMDRLDAMGFQYSSNTVITEHNRRQLPDIARLAAGRGVYAANFIAFNAYHAWRGQSQASTLQTAYSSIRPHLEEAVAILDQAGLAVNLRYVPLCAFPSLARHVVGVLGVPYDPYEWRNRCMNYDREPAHCAEPLPIPATGVREIFAYSPLEQTLPDGTELCGMRGDRFKLFPRQCAQCPVRPACDGVDPTYLARYGAAEFAPLDMDVSGPLLRARLEYGRPFLVKAAPLADMRAVMAGLRKP